MGNWGIWTASTNEKKGEKVKMNCYIIFLFLRGEVCGGMTVLVLAAMRVKRESGKAVGGLPVLLGVLYYD